jgi:tetratricopeptide (TPR) repeat protein
MRRSGERLTLDLVRNDIGTEVRDQVDTETVKQRSAPPIRDPIANLPTWEDSLPIRLAELLELDLTPEERRLLTEGGTTVPRAHELYLRGTGHLYPYEAKEDVDAGIRLFEQAIGQDPAYAPAYVGLGYAYVRKYLGTEDGRWADLAVLSCETALEKCGSLAEVHAGLGRIHRTVGDYAEAAQHFEQALEADSTDFTLHYDLGYTYDVQGMAADAEASYKRVLRMRPDHIGVLDLLGYLYLRQGKYEDAIKLLRRLVTLEPHRTKGYTHLGIAYFALDHVAEAERMFEQALANADTTYAVCSNLGTIYYWQSRYADAARMYKTALTKNDADYKVWGNLAGCYYWMPGETEKADASFEKAAGLARSKLEIEPDNPEVLCDLASYCAVMGDRSESERLLNRIVSLGPADPIMIFRIAETYEQLGERDLALDWIEKALRGGAPAVKVRRYPGLRDLRADPRYRELLNDIDTT